MDNVSEMPQSAPTQFISQVPEYPLKKSSGIIRKIFNTSSWLVLFAFLPITVLILLSQNTIPGDLFYPVKRGLEGAVLATASVNPATRVAFRTDLTERRFDEAEKLLARADTAGLNGFIEEIQTTQQEVSTLLNISSKQELTDKLVKQIDAYQNKLDKAQAQNEGSLPVPSFVPVDTLAPTSIPQEPTATPFIAKIFSPTPQFQEPTSSPIPSRIGQTESSPTPFIELTSTATPAKDPTPTQIPIVPTIVIPNLPDNITVAIDDTKKQLEEIKKKLLGKQKEKTKIENHSRTLENSSVGQNPNSKDNIQKNDSFEKQQEHKNGKN